MLTATMMDCHEGLEGAGTGSMMLMPAMVMFRTEARDPSCTALTMVEVRFCSSVIDKSVNK